MEGTPMNRFTALAAVAVVTFAAGLVQGATVSHAGEIGRVGVDWIGNDIVIDAIEDPKVEGVTCHVAYFDRSLIDRLQQGNWFEDPSNSSIDCVQTGPIKIGDVDLDQNGEEVFEEKRSLIFKSLVVNRVYDKAHDALIYLSHTRQVNVGSAKMSISVVPLASTDAIWSEGRPDSGE
jgi:CreA protein